VRESDFNQIVLISLLLNSLLYLNINIYLLKHFQLIALGARNKLLQWCQYNYCCTECFWYWDKI